MCVIDSEVSIEDLETVG
jgi:hypothetical protein